MFSCLKKMKEEGVKKRKPSTLDNPSLGGEEKKKDHETIAE